MHWVMKSLGKLVKKDGSLVVENRISNMRTTLHATSELSFLNKELSHSVAQNCMVSID